LHRRIYDGIAGTEPSWRDKQVNVDYCWSGNRPRGVNGSSYRVELSGRLVVPDDPGPALRILVAGRIRVSLDDACVLENWSDGPVRNYHVPVQRYRGRTVSLEIAYGHEDGDAVVLVGWDETTLEPVAGGGRQERTVYLPSTEWHDFWTGEQMRGGRIVTMPAPLDRIPVLVRAGTILPLGPHKQWHDEVPDNPLEVRVYPGSDGKFTLYEDAGDGYAYERGECATIHMTWDDSARTLTIGDRRGSFPGMLMERKLRIVVVRPGNGVGIGVTEHGDGEVLYNGARAALNL
jgi:alpha-D-xyloside xylohydrolase